MKNLMKKSLLFGVLAVTAVCLTGCGEEPYELETNERAIIVNYAAHIVAKYNTKQPEGYKYVFVPEEEEEEPQVEESEETVEEETTEEGTETGESEPEQQNDPEEMTLTQALGIPGVTAVFTGAQLVDRYETVIPDQGNVLAILHVTLQNQTDKSVDCDILSRKPIFLAKVNQTEKVTAELTLLMNNLGTYQGVIGAGESVETIIMLQLDAQNVTSIDQLEMSITSGEQRSKVVFL